MHPTHFRGFSGLPLRNFVEAAAHRREVQYALWVTVLHNMLKKKKVPVSGARDVPVDEDSLDSPEPRIMPSLKVSKTSNGTAVVQSRMPTLCITRNKYACRGS